MCLQLALGGPVRRWLIVLGVLAGLYLVWFLLAVEVGRGHG